MSATACLSHLLAESACTQLKHRTCHLASKWRQNYTRISSFRSRRPMADSPSVASQWGISFQCVGPALWQGAGLINGSTVGLWPSSCHVAVPSLALSFLLLSLFLTFSIVPWLIVCFFLFIQCHLVFISYILFLVSPFPLFCFYNLPLFYFDRQLFLSPSTCLFLSL